MAAFDARGMRVRMKMGKILSFHLLPRVISLYNCNHWSIERELI